MLPIFSLASHIAGGSITYKFLRDTVMGSTHARVYQVQLEIYQNCINGQPEALDQDNPAFLGCFINNSSFTPFLMDTAIYYLTSVTLPVKLTTDCNSIIPTFPLCLMKKTFVKRYVLPNNPYGYIISYQRCCWSAAIANIKNSGGVGITLSCTIPGNIPNNSAVFKNEVPPGICINQVLAFDHSATDADGDSLSYELCPTFQGASEANIKPPPGPPPYDTLQFMPPATYHNPIIGTFPLSIDSITGKIFCLPNATGRYVVSVCCKEWRNGTLINTTSRVFATMVGSCTVTNISFTPNIGNDTTIFAGQRLHLHGGIGKYFLWKPISLVSDSTAHDPIVYFPLPGHYTITALVVDDSGCTGQDVMEIEVLSHSEFAVPNAFSPNGDNVNDILTPIPIKGSNLISFKIFNRWGNLVYNGGPSDPGWDGTYKGTLQDMGVYYWHLEYQDTFGDQYSMSGNATLVR